MNQPDRPFVRAGRSQKDTIDNEHRWFHTLCFARDNKGFPCAIDFPTKARSEHTACVVCREPINNHSGVKPS